MISFIKHTVSKSFIHAVALVLCCILLPNNTLLYEYATFYLHIKLMARRLLRLFWLF